MTCRYPEPLCIRHISNYYEYELNIFGYVISILWVFFVYYWYVFCFPEFLQRNAVPQPAARVTGTKQLYPKPSRLRLVSQLVQHTHTHTHTFTYTQFPHLLNAKHSHKYKCSTHRVFVSHSGHTDKKHTQSVVHKYYLVNILRGHVQVHFQSHKNQTKFRHKVTWNWVTTKQKPRTHRKLPHQPTKQREYVRMIIMTDNKKETNQNQKA